MFNKYKNIPKEAIIIDKLKSGDIIYAFNFQFEGKNYHHINKIDYKGNIKSNEVFRGEYKKI